MLRLAGVRVLSISFERAVVDFSVQALCSVIFAARTAVAQRRMHSVSCNHESHGCAR